jgi:hypothetical protein
MRVIAGGYNGPQITQITGRMICGRRRLAGNRRVGLRNCCGAAEPPESPGWSIGLKAA